MLSFWDLTGFGLREVLVIFVLELFSDALVNAFLLLFWKMHGITLAARWTSVSCGQSTGYILYLMNGLAPSYTAHIMVVIIVLVMISVQSGRFASIVFGVTCGFNPCWYRYPLCLAVHSGVTYFWLSAS